MHCFGRLRGVIARHKDRSFRKRNALPAVVVVWSILIVLGLVRWAQYEGEPGEAAIAPLQWPFVADLQRDQNRPTLVVALHPECPCSRATVSELSVLMAQSLHQLRAYVVFLHLQDADRATVETTLWREASRIPGVEVIDDQNGDLLREFGALTSGQTYLFDHRGQLVFQGGITPARGQTGANRGSLAIASYLATSTSSTRQTPTYGCSLSSLIADALGGK